MTPQVDIISLHYSTSLPLNYYRMQMSRIFFCSLSPRALLNNFKTHSWLWYLRKNSIHSIDFCCSDSKRTFWFISRSPAIVLNLGRVSTPTFPVKLNGKNLKNVIKHRIKEQRKFIRPERSVWSLEMRSKLIKKKENFSKAFRTSLLVNKRACYIYVQY